MRTKNPELERRIGEYVEEYCLNNGCGPTVREVARCFRIAVSTAHAYLTDLKDSGMLEPGPSGNYESSDYAVDRDMIRIELMGTISCGPLSEERQQRRGYVRLPRSVTGTGEFFFLEASGNSMTGAGIDDGDLLLVKRVTEAASGKIVVALCDNEVTLKRLARDKKGKVYLHPENDDYEDIYASSIVIQGVVSKIIKDPDRRSGSVGRFTVHEYGF